MKHKPNYLIRVLLFTALLLGLTHIGVDALTGALTPGEPGLSFRYVGTFGETGAAYPPDPQHQYLNRPFGIDVDASGNLWVAEAEGNFVAKYAPDGSLLDSIGVPGWRAYSDESHFTRSLEVSLDPGGNPWVVDSGAHSVIKYDSDGNYLTQLGITGESGADESHFNGPSGVAFDGAGSIYVADTGNHRVQVFDSSGVYSTTLGVTGEPDDDNSHFNSPHHLFLDDSDNLYIADTLNHRVQIFDSSLTYLDTLGVSGESGDDNLHLTRPEGVTVDATSIYVADSGIHRVQVYDRTTFIHQDTLGWGTGNYAFDWPADVSLDSDGNLYVADTLHNRVQKFNSSLAYVRTFGITDVPYVSDVYHYNGPEDVAVDANGRIAITEGWWYGHRLIVLDATGEPQFSVGEAGVSGNDNAHFNDPAGVAFDANGNIYVADGWNHRIQIFTASGIYSATLGIGYGQGNYQFYAPNGLTVDGIGNIYVADSFNHRVQIFDSELNYVGSLGVTGETGSDNDHFNWPLDVEVDVNGNIYVADTENHRVQVFDSSYSLQMTLGVTGECGGDNDHFCEPWGVALDSAGNIYVSEKFGPRVQVFDPHGAYLTTIGGAWGDASGGLRCPAGVDVDDQGNVYIADLDNHRVQKYVPGVPEWQQVNINGFGERSARGITALDVFNDQLYAGTTDLEAGGQIYRSSDGVTWSPVSGPGFGTYTSDLPAIFDLAVFEGQLYAGAGYGGVPGQVWRSPDGATWEAVVPDGFGDDGNQVVSIFATFDGMFYAGTSNGSGAQIWRSSSGSASDWTEVAPDEAGTESATGVTGLSVYKDMIYAAVEGETTAQVWRSANGSGWDTVVADGFGNANNHGSGGFAEYHDYLYLGIGNDVSGAQLWRTADGTTWEQVVGDGFGDSANSKVEMLTVFAGRLYAGINNPETGLEIFRSSDGMLWQQVLSGGFGDSNNWATLWNNSTAKFQNRLHIGTWNSANGGEIWRYDLQEKLMFLPLIQR